MDQLRVLIGILGMDQHEVGAMTVARMLRDAGMEVIYSGRFNLPKNLIPLILQEDIDVIGLSCHSWEYLYYLPELFELLEKEEITVPVVVGGSLFSAEDSANLKKMGVAAVFGPAATREQIVETIRRLKNN